MRILVTRPEAEAARTAALIVAAGHEPVVAPMLEVVIARDARLDLAGVQAVALTSGNAVRALAQLDDCASLRSLPTFTVGGATAKQARAQGFSRIISAGGDGAALIAEIAARLRPADGAVLWATGRDRAVDLASVLGQRGFSVRMVEVYRTEAIGHLPREACDAMSQAGSGTASPAGIDAVTIFSRRTAEAYLAAVVADGVIEQARRTPTSVISAEAAAPLVAAGFSAIVIATEPTAAAVLGAIASTPTI
ncbi:MAG: uroporphyrinogen-III synthase [Hyphomicrobiaceae bacterium]|nr:uroporphyrinogen-III synthase [Hyphomicrobiaceae bacterium]